MRWETVWVTDCSTGPGRKSENANEGRVVSSTLIIPRRGGVFYRLIIKTGEPTKRPATLADLETTYQ
jgi:hypothetical protein